MRLVAKLGRARIPLQVDVPFGGKIEPPPQLVEYPTLLGAAAPRVRAYRPETLISEKFEAAVALGQTNGRMKDLHDLAVLPERLSFEGSVVLRAILATFRDRRRAIPDSFAAALPAGFLTDAAVVARWEVQLAGGGVETVRPQLGADRVGDAGRLGGCEGGVRLAVTLPREHDAFDLRRAVEVRRAAVRAEVGAVAPEGTVLHEGVLQEDLLPAKDVRLRVDRRAVGSHRALRDRRRVPARPRGDEREDYEARDRDQDRGVPPPLRERPVVVGGVFHGPFLRFVAGTSLVAPGDRSCAAWSRRLCTSSGADAGPERRRRTELVSADVWDSM